MQSSTRLYPDAPKGKRYELRDVSSGEKDNMAARPPNQRPNIILSRWLACLRQRSQGGLDDRCVRHVVEEAERHLHPFRAAVCVIARTNRREG